jgi:hypothetical protein
MLAAARCRPSGTEGATQHRRACASTPPPTRRSIVSKTFIDGSVSAAGSYFHPPGRYCPVTEATRRRHPATMRQLPAPERVGRDPTPAAPGLHVMPEQAAIVSARDQGAPVRQHARSHSRTTCDVPRRPRACPVARSTAYTVPSAQAANARVPSGVSRQTQHAGGQLVIVEESVSWRTGPSGQQVADRFRPVLHPMEGRHAGQVVLGVRIDPSAVKIVANRFCSLYGFSITSTPSASVAP